MLIGLFVAIAAIVVPAIFFIISAPDEIKIQSIIIFGIILIIVIVISFGYLIYRGYRKVFSDMDVRLRFIEGLLDRNFKNKKGQFIDPRIIWIIVLLILLYLFLKSVGVLS